MAHPNMAHPNMAHPNMAHERCAAGGARTSNTPPSTATRETSNVPPPRSYTRMLSDEPLRSRPNAIAAAVGSLSTRSTFRPAIAARGPRARSRRKWQTSHAAQTPRAHTHNEGCGRA
eukprot:5498846-Prymnesium_polylepis.1